MDKNKATAKTIRILIALLVFTATGYLFYLWLLKKDLNSYHPQYKHKNEVNILVLDGVLAPSAIQAMQEILKVNLNVKVLTSEEQLLEELKKSDYKYDIVQVPPDYKDLSVDFVELQTAKLPTLQSVAQDLKSPLIQISKLYKIPALWGFYFVTQPMLTAKKLNFIGSVSHYTQLKTRIPELSKMARVEPNQKADPSALTLAVNRSSELGSPLEIKSAALFGIYFGINASSVSKELSYRVLQLLIDENIALKNAVGAKLGALHNTAEFQGLEAYQKPSFLRNVPLTKIFILN